MTEPFLAPSFARLRSSGLAPERPSMMTQDALLILSMSHSASLPLPCSALITSMSSTWSGPSSVTIAAERAAVLPSVVNLTP